MVSAQLGDSLKPSGLLALMEEAESLGIRVDPQKGLSKADYTLAMLHSLGKVHSADLAICYAHFQKLDAMHDGKLGIGDTREFDEVDLKLTDVAPVTPITI